MHRAFLSTPKTRIPQGGVRRHAEKLSCYGQNLIALLAAKENAMRTNESLASRFAIVIAAATVFGFTAQGASALQRAAATSTTAFANGPAENFADTGEPHPFHFDGYIIPVRHQRLTSDNNDAAEEGRSFAARLKHKQGRNLARKKRRFRQQQAWLEKQRRVMRQKRAAARAHQYAAARRHAGKRSGKKPRRLRPLK